MAGATTQEAGASQLFSGYLYATGGVQGAGMATSEADLLLHDPVRLGDAENLQPE